QCLTYQARDDVGRAAGAETFKQVHRPRRIALRPRNTRRDWQRGNAHGQMQKLSTVGKFHSEPPFTSFDHLVGEADQWQWHREPEGLGNLEVDDEGVFVRPLDRQIARFCTLEDAINVACRLLELLE